MPHRLDAQRHRPALPGQVMGGRSYRLCTRRDTTAQSGQAADLWRGRVRMAMRSGLGRTCWTSGPAGIRGRRRLGKEGFRSDGDAFLLRAHSARKRRPPQHGECGRTGDWTPGDTKADPARPWTVFNPSRNLRPLGVGLVAWESTVNVARVESSMSPDGPASSPGGGDSNCPTRGESRAQDGHRLGTCRVLVAQEVLVGGLLFREAQFAPGAALRTRRPWKRAGRPGFLSRGGIRGRPPDSRHLRALRG